MAGEKTLTDHVRARIEASTDLQALFTARSRTLSEQIFPRFDNTEVDTDDFGQNTPKPFIVLRDNGLADTALLYSSAAQIWVYDDPLYNYTFIIDAVNALRRTLSRWLVPASVQNYPQWVELRFAGEGPRTVDEGWALHFQTVSVRAIGG